MQALVPGFDELMVRSQFSWLSQCPGQVKFWTDDQTWRVDCPIHNHLPQLGNKKKLVFYSWLRFPMDSFNIYHYNISVLKGVLFFKHTYMFLFCKANIAYVLQYGWPCHSPCKTKVAVENVAVEIYGGWNDMKLNWNYLLKYFVFNFLHICKNVLDNQVSLWTTKNGKWPSKQRA